MKRTPVRIAAFAATLCVASAIFPTAAQGAECPMTKIDAMPAGEITSTGILVHKGDELYVNIEEGQSADAELLVGTDSGPFGSNYEDLNGGVSTKWERLPLKAGENWYTMPIDGLVYVDNASESGGNVTFYGGTHVPRFELGKTTDADWKRQLTEYASAPFIELVSDRTIATFRQDTVLEALDGRSPAEALEYFDRTVNFYDELSGKSEDLPEPHTSNNRKLRLQQPDNIDSGVYAYAAGDYMGYQEGAVGVLLDGDYSNDWVWWHELGHLYQSWRINWSIPTADGGEQNALTEVVNNVFALAIQQELGFPSRLDEPAKRERLREFFAQPVSERAFLTDIDDVFVRLYLFEQLRQAYGNEYHARLYQLLREDAANNVPYPSTSSEQVQYFAVTAAKAAGRDLSAFFAEWGLPLTAETKAALGAYPAAGAISTSFISASTPVVEPRSAAAAPAPAPEAPAAPAAPAPTTPKVLTENPDPAKTAPVESASGETDPVETSTSSGATDKPKPPTPSTPVDPEPSGEPVDPSDPAQTTQPGTPAVTPPTPVQDPTSNGLALTGNDPLPVLGFGFALLAGLLAVTAVGFVRLQRLQAQATRRH